MYCSSACAAASDLLILWCLRRSRAVGGERVKKEAAAWLGVGMGVGVGVGKGLGLALALELGLELG